ncbi:MAG: hypothetical protein ACE5J3_05820 [Methanosarcinales archaeon]
MSMNYIDISISNMKIAHEQEKRIKNSLKMHASVFLKENKIIDYSQYMVFRVYNKETNKTYTIEIEKNIEDIKPERIWASCDCPDFMERITNNKWNIACKHIYKSIFSLSQQSYIDLVNRRVTMPSKTETIKINYLDQKCPKCNSKAVVEYKKLSCIFCKPNPHAKYACESCYHVW